MGKIKKSDRLTADSDIWAIRQNGEIKLTGDGISIRMVFRNLCSMNFTGKEYEQYIVFPLSEGFVLGDIEPVNHSQVIMKGTIYGNG